MGDVFRERLSRLRAAVREAGLDGVVVNSLNDIYYYTGKSVSKGDPGFLLVTRKSGTLFVSSLDNRLEGPGVRVLGDFKEMKKEFRKSGSLGFDEGNTSVFTFRKLGGGKWKPFSEQLKSLRMVKDQGEVTRMRRAASATLSIMKSLELKGRAEIEIAADIHNGIRMQGYAPAFDPIVAAGRNSALIHFMPGRTRVTRGLVIIDMGVCRDAYNSDVTRTFSFDPKPGEERLVEQCREIQQELISMATPGTVFGDIQKRYETLMKEMGHQVMHSFGHGLGLSVHERPSGKDVLKKGMVITVEPGIYRKGLGGCRIEDMVLVGDKPVVISR